jgi:excisionase family DNA binding protein
VNLNKIGKQPNDVMTIEELSDYLKISMSSLYKYAQQGKIPCQKIGKHWRFRKAAIDKWLDETQANESNYFGEQ